MNYLSNKRGNYHYLLREKITRISKRGLPQSKSNRCRRYLLAPLIFVSGIIVFFPIVQQADAVVTDDIPLSESDPSGTTVYNGFNWDVVYNIPGGSAVAVDSHWTLTADHVAGGSFTSGGITYSVLEEHSHSEADIRLTRYDNSFPDWYPIYSGTYPLPPPPKVTKMTGLMVGYGRSGNVLTDTTYDWDGSSTEGTRRWGDSLIDSAGNSTDVGDYIDLNFDNTATNYAGGAGYRDSGGGIFVYDTEWYLGGIMSRVLTPEAGVYSGTRAVDLTSYETWITQKIPEPGTGLLLLTAGILLFANRRFGRTS